MGLQLGRDRLCLVQIADGRGDEHLVRFARGSAYDAPNLKAVLADPARLKLYHFARFDLAAIYAYLGVMAAPVYCTKTASRLIRTYTDRHGLKELVKEVLGQEISKQQQTLGLGRARAQRRAEGLCRLRRALSPRAEGEARRPAGARGAHAARPGLLRFPAAAGPLLDLAGWAESRHFRPCLSLPSKERAGQARLGDPRRRPRSPRPVLKLGLPAWSASSSPSSSSRRSSDKQEVSFLLDKNKVADRARAAPRSRRAISRPGQSGPALRRSAPARRCSRPRRCRSSRSAT